MAMDDAESAFAILKHSECTPWCVSIRKFATGRADREEIPQLQAQPALRAACLRRLPTAGLLSAPIGERRAHRLRHRAQGEPARERANVAGRPAQADLLPSHGFGETQAAEPEAVEHHDVG